MSFLDPSLEKFFADRGWELRTHQQQSLNAGQDRRHALITAPTGSGKTLAGFLPILHQWVSGNINCDTGPVALYITPLKVLAADMARNLEAPCAGFSRPFVIGVRTGDTSSHERAKQWASPPALLILTPEQLALMLSHPRSIRYFSGVQDVIIDEIHALAPGKRGDLLALCLARLRCLGSPRLVGLSATVDDPIEMSSWMVADEEVVLIEGPTAALPDVHIVQPDGYIPWAGHGAGHAVEELLELIKNHELTLLFVNTRNHAEHLFAQLWLKNEQNLAIGLHHGSLSRTQRTKVEQAINQGRLQAVVATSTLDLGVDWGDVDLVVQVGAPKGSGRLIQRIGRANHRLEEPSRAFLVPSNRFEYLECLGAKAALMEQKSDPLDLHEGHWDVLCQHIMGRACAEPFSKDELLSEVKKAAPYQSIDENIVMECLGFVCDGGYALRGYEQYDRLKEVDGKFMVTSAEHRRRYRAQVGTIIDTPMVRVTPAKFVAQKWRPASEAVGEVEEWFAASLRVGDSFIISGRTWAFMHLDTDKLLVVPASGQAVIPSFQGGKFPLTTHLAQRVREMIAEPERFHLDNAVSAWLDMQRQRSALPQADQMLVETFPRGDRFYLVAYPFEGRLAHQSLGMLLTRRLDRLGCIPLGFCANEYGLAIWMAKDAGGVVMHDLFAEDMLGDDLEAWLRDSAVAKRSFGYVARIAGLIGGSTARGRDPGNRFSPELVYDVLLRHQPDHVLMRASLRDAADEVLNLARLQTALKRIQGQIVHKNLQKISPLSVPIMLEVGREPVFSESQDELLEQWATDLWAQMS